MTCSSRLVLVPAMQVYSSYFYHRRSKVQLTVSK
jgi:hypothetical protein